MVQNTSFYMSIHFLSKILNLKILNGILMVILGPTLGTIQGPVIFVVLWKRSNADVVDLILYSVPNMLHAQCHVGKRQNKQNASLSYDNCIIQHPPY